MVSNLEKNNTFLCNCGRANKYQGYCCSHNSYAEPGDVVHTKLLTTYLTNHHLKKLDALTEHHGFQQLLLSFVRLQVSTELP